MNRRARYISTRSLGLAGIATLVAGLMAAFGQSAAPQSRTLHGAISAGPWTRCSTPRCGRLIRPM